ncbi:mechanosensitive ion channel domain-containing protein [Roseibium aggregatum]|uniref:Mechanosensitive ion channel n=1 Tax=Roseibium aggregatum TaxID=187304 RepID=A0A926P0W2_9HYPH|nr:mechanosensitive ion channel domain-containing protein [Roseibium aggregatum]MBD1547368.1 mechanosensitive ion channel [Roseibium aggregatum]
MTVLMRCLAVSLVCLVATIGQAQETTPSNATAPATPATTTAPVAAAPPASVGAAVDAIAKLLEDPKGRDALIEALRQKSRTDQPAPGNQAAGQDQTSSQGQATGASGSTSDAAAQPAAGGTDTGAQSPQDAAATAPDNFAVQLGQYTKVIADDVSSLVLRVAHSFRGVTLLLNGDIQVRWDKARIAALEVVMVLSAAVLLFWLGQKLLTYLFHRWALRARYGSWTQRAGILLATTVADVVTVVVGWGAGYAAALIDYGMLDHGVSLLESLALNAFLITGLTKVGLRFFFAPERRELRLFPFSDRLASYWCRQLGFVVALMGYGIMLGVPVANLAVSFVIGNAVRALVVILSALILFTLIHRNRREVAHGLSAHADQMPGAFGKRAMKVFARIWHICANFYVLLVFGLWLTSPFQAVAIAIRATGLSVLTIMAGTAVTLIMTRAITGGIRLPEELKKSLPALQGRINAFVPRLLKLLRIFVFLVTLVLLLEIWGFIDIVGWLHSAQGITIIGRFSSAFLVVVIAFVVWLGVMSWIDLRLREQTGYVVTARVRTLFQLFRNAFTVLVIVMAALLGLSELGVDIGPLIAGAGVVGLAISFGAQTLVKDIITGAFIQIENAINEGDVVTVGGVTGVVERLTVRSVRLRDLDGTTHIVPFSAVDTVSNFMRDFSYHVAVIGVAYDTDVRKAKAALEEAFQRLKKTDYGNKIIGDLEMHGVTNFGDSAIDIRARIMTTPGDQWSVGRAYNEFVKDVFDEWGIEIPFPQVTYHAAGAATPTAASSKPLARGHNEEDAEGDGAGEGAAGYSTSSSDE